MQRASSLFAGFFLTALLGLSPALAADKSTTTPTPATEKSKADTKASTTKSSTPLDINTASMDELKALKGIGDAYAKKIVDNRPYERKDELVRKKVIPEKTYDEIKEQIVARQDKSTKSTPTTKDAAPAKTTK